MIDRLSNVTIGAAMIEDLAQVSDSAQPVTAEDRAARLGQKPAVLAVTAELFAQSQQLERASLSDGIVVIAQANLNADSINLLRETGITVLVDQLFLPTFIDNPIQKLPEWLNTCRRLGFWQSTAPVHYGGNNPNWRRLKRAEWLCPALINSQRSISACNCSGLRATVSP